VVAVIRYASGVPENTVLLMLSSRGLARVRRIQHLCCVPQLGTSGSIFGTISCAAIRLPEGNAVDRESDQLRSAEDLQNDWGNSWLFRLTASIFPRRGWGDRKNSDQVPAIGYAAPMW
jgi:hypothetical protein